MKIFTPIPNLYPVKAIKQSLFEMKPKSLDEAVIIAENTLKELVPAATPKISLYTRDNLVGKISFEYKRPVDDKVLSCSLTIFL
jgi:hypothetical protein